MRFSTVLAVSVAASASTALAYPAPSSARAVSRRETEDMVDLLLRSYDYDELVELAARVYIDPKAGAKKLPAEVLANIGKQGLDGSKAAAARAKALGTSTKDIQKGYQKKLNKEITGTAKHTPHNTQFARDLDFDAELEELMARVYIDPKAGAKKLPAEVLANIGKQGLDGSKAAAARAKALGTSTKDIQKGYQKKLNKEITGTAKHTPHNTQFARDLDFDAELEELMARVYIDPKAGAKKLPAEVLANIGKQGLDGSKAAAARAKALGTSTKDIQKGYQKKLNKEITGTAKHTPHNTQFARDLDFDAELEELLARVYIDPKAGAKKLPAEVLANIGKQGLDGSKAAAARAKALGTSTKDIQKGYQKKLNKEITGTAKHTPHNTQFARDLVAEYYDDLD